MIVGWLFDWVIINQGRPCQIIYAVKLKRNYASIIRGSGGWSHIQLISNQTPALLHTLHNHPRVYSTYLFLSHIYYNLTLYCTPHLLILQLGEGAFSVVIEATKKTTGQTYAVKVVTKSKLTQEDEVALRDEIQVLKELQHEHIIRLYDVFEEKSYWYLVTEQMKGGELFDR